MQVAEGHDGYYFYEHNGTATAFFRASDVGVSVSLHGIGRTSLEHVNFSISPEEGQEIGEVADHLVSLVPDLEVSRRMHEVQRQRNLRELGFDQGPLRGLAPTVHTIDATGEHNWTFRGGDLEGGEDELGGLVWTREQLILRVEKVDALNFRPDPFKLFATIAANRPDFPAKKSIWANL